jgi:ferredoxin
VDAIKPDTEAGAKDWVDFNQMYSDIWPNIVTKIDAMPDNEKWDGVANKIEHFSKEPGEGN